MDMGASIRASRFAALARLHRKLVSDLHALSKSTSGATVHHARVHARRLRIIIKALGAECRPSAASTLLFDLRDIGRALASLREADVRMRYVASLLTANNIVNKDATRLLIQLRHELADRQRTLQREMQSRAWSSRMRRIAKCFADDELLALSPSGAEAMPEVSAVTHNLSRIRRMLRRKFHDAAELHALRIRIKRVRYLHEFLVELGVKSSARSVRHLEKWQTALGVMHDHLETDVWLGNSDIKSALKLRLRVALKKSKQRDLRRLNRLRKTIPELFAS